nr:hypothetical protein Iba_chr01bCG4860 [Ipomoea batatas]
MEKGKPSTPTAATAASRTEGRVPPCCPPPCTAPFCYREDAIVNCSASPTIHYRLFRQPLGMIRRKGSRGSIGAARDFAADEKELKLLPLMSATAVSREMSSCSLACYRCPREARRMGRLPEMVVVDAALPSKAVACCHVEEEDGDTGIHPCHRRSFPGYGLIEYACDFSSAGYGLLSKMSGQNVASKFRRMFVLGFCFVDFFLGFGFVLNLGTSDSTLEGWESF